jgi:polyhydroxyalkanoate synthase
VIGRAQQMMMEFGAQAMKQAPSTGASAFPGFDPQAIMQAQADFWADGMKLWQGFLTPDAAPPEEPAEHARDKRFKAPQWRANPAFDMIRRSYLLISDHMLKGVDQVEGLEPKQKEQLKFATRGFLDAMSPSNFAFTNPQVMEKMIETKGESLLKGLQNMLSDIGKGQLTHTDASAFEIGRNIAMTPGKVVHETPLYQLIQYDPTTETVHETPLVIFPPWINRFYILDLNPEKSFIRWAVEQGLTVFVVSWKSADASMKDVVWDDYVGAQTDAIDTIRDGLGVESVHAIGYCVAGTTLAATLAVLAARKQAEKVRSATFFTAQIDFSQAGDLQVFVDDNQMQLIESMSGEGFLDGRYMAATFNLLRGRDLIWNYVAQNYLMGEDYPPFDLLHWNGDTTNLPAKWHKGYLTDLYRDNLLVTPGAMAIGGTPIDLTTVKRVEDDRSFHRPDQVRAGGIGAYRRGGQSARGDEIPVLDQRQEGEEPGRVRRGRDRDQGQLVARLGAMARKARRQEGQGQGRADARQGQAEGDRGRTGALRSPALSALCYLFVAPHHFSLEPNHRLPYVAVQQKTHWETYRWRPSLRSNRQRLQKRQRPLPSSRR